MKKRIVQYFIYNRFGEQLTARMHRWLGRHADDPQMDDYLFEVWNGIEALPDRQTARSLSEVKKRIGTPMLRRRKLLKRLAGAAAAVVVSAMFISSIYMYNNSRDVVAAEIIEIVVPQGEIRQFTLSDGSVVSLNAGSVLIYPTDFIGNTRNVYLSGEGYFEVVTDPAKPFIVKTHLMEVTARGTSFNVNAYPGSGKAVATLSSGEIEVEGESERERFRHVISPGQQVEYDSREGHVVSRSVDPGEIIGWREGQLHFVNQSLSQIIPALERRFGVTIRVNTEINQQERYTLKFTKNESLDYVLSVLSKAAGSYRYSIEENLVNIYLTKK